MLPPETAERFDDAYRKLMVSRIRHRLGLASKRDAVEDGEIAFLLSVASRFALGSDGVSEIEASVQKRQAYDICTAALDVLPDKAPALMPAVELILARIGNFPAASLVEKRQRERTPLPSYLLLETAARRFENTVHLNGHAVTLTDFQARLLDSLARTTSLSVSAPTSAGKSFSLSVEIVRRFERGGFSCIVYLVPTRALIRQVMYETIKQLNDAGLTDVPVLCVPDANAAETSSRGAVYVLTQERLATLLFSPDMRKAIDVLIVDEAQEIGENRGLILESVIDLAVSRHPRAAVFFSSPLTQNPAYLLSVFDRSDEGEYFIEHLAPVTQNVITVKPVSRKPNEAQVEILLAGQVHEVGRLEFPFEFRGGHFATIAAQFTQQHECSILYANGASEAEGLAQELADQLPEQFDIPDKVSDLIDFVRTHIHPRYRLADFLSKGVAFHYGRMPQVVRARIEDLLKERAIRFVCCTSTLLQGVNLPAKNIFIQNPKKGMGRPMRNQDFWNLAGRAGRLTQEFDGNVWCIFEKKWESNPLEGDRLGDIQSVFERTLRCDVERVVEFAELPQAPADVEEVRIPEQVLARIFVHFTLNERLISESGFATPKNRIALARIDQRCIEIRESATLPEDVFLRNSTVSPERLEHLAALFRNSSDLTALLPQLPFTSKSAYANVQEIFRLLDVVFFKSGKQSYKYYCWLATQWMIGASLKELVAQKVERDGAGDDKKRISDAIRKLFKELENTLRFQYVKYLRAYNDVLAAVLKERGRSKEADSITPLHLYIEYGAAEETLVSLMSLGLSRTTSILFKDAHKLPADLDRAKCQAEINRVDLSTLNLADICLDEIRRIRRVQ